MLDLKCKGLIDFRDVVDALDNQEEEVKKIDLTSNDIRSVREKTFFLMKYFVPHSNINLFICRY